VGFGKAGFIGTWPLTTPSGKVSLIVVGIFTDDFSLRGEGIEGRASDAVDEIVGVACDEEIIAGTEVDFTTGLIRLPEN